MEKGEPVLGVIKRRGGREMVSIVFNKGKEESKRSMADPLLLISSCTILASLHAVAGAGDGREKAQLRLSRLRAKLAVCWNVPWGGLARPGGWLDICTLIARPDLGPWLSLEPMPLPAASRGTFDASTNRTSPLLSSEACQVIRPPLVTQIR